MNSAFSCAYTVKILDIGTTKTITVIVRNNRKCNVGEMRLKDTDRMENSVDPDQTAPFRSSLIWAGTVGSDLYVPILRILRICECLGIHKGVCFL